MTDTCISCHEVLRDAPYLSCLQCKYTYHLGACSGVTESAYKKKYAAAKNSWSCATCKTSKARSSKCAELENVEQEMNLAKEIGEIQKKLSLLLSMKSQVDALAGVADTVCGIERSLQEMSSKYDDGLVEMKRQSTDMSNLRKRVEKLETQTNNSEVEMLKQEVNNLDQYSRRLNLEIHGLGEQTNEKVIEKLNLLADELELPKLSGKDIEAAHRLRTRAGTDGGDKPSPIIVRFSARCTRDAWLAKRGELRKKNSKVFINENLTAQNKRLFWQMKTKAREMKYQFAWVKDGKFFVRRSERDRVIRIKTASDLDLIR
ncbi:uncharacterized protein LOC142814505 [Rhipicephalus microplus]|uniref:uncharacterized protein LOC142814505 n=1 Tax=Rhipicephalus microplus TaxID=6941 RepID=UPI003F6D3A92